MVLLTLVTVAQMLQQHSAPWPWRPEHRPRTQTKQNVGAAEVT